MRLTGIDIAGFKCFLQGTFLEFEREPGLYFLTGENLLAPELGANACGKSSLLDAISWCLFGKTMRKLKAKDVEAWDGDGHVSVVLHLNGEYVRRSRKPNYLGFVDSDGLELQPLTQEELEVWLGMSYEMFTNSVVFGQFNRPFLDLLPSEKEKLFSETLDLDSWIAYSEQATDKVHSMEDRVSDLGRQRARLEGELVALEQRDYIQAADDWDSDQKDRIDRTVKELNSVAMELDGLQEKNKKLQDTRRQAKEVLDDINLERRELQGDFDDLERLLQSYRREHDKIWSKEKEMDRHFSEVSVLEGTCTLCGQTIHEATVEDHLADLERGIDKAQEDRKDLEQKALRTQDELKRLRREQDKLFKEQREWEDKQVYARSEKEYLADTKRKLIAQEKALVTKVSELKKERNPFVQLEEEREESIVLLEEEVQAVNHRIDICSGRQEAYKYWVRGFRDVRLYLMDERLGELEYEVNNALSELGLPDWRIAFTTERKVGRGKKKAYKPGFFVRIDNGTDMQVPWEAWSGGESQRLRLAGSMGFASMLLNHAGVDSDIEFWDEPSAYLSEEGIEDLLDALYYRARDKGKRIWIIDHRSLAYGGFADTVTVVSDKGGSYFK